MQLFTKIIRLAAVRTEEDLYFPLTMILLTWLWTISVTSPLLCSKDPINHYKKMEKGANAPTIHSRGNPEGFPNVGSMFAERCWQGLLWEPSFVTLANENHKTKFIIHFKHNWVYLKILKNWNISIYLKFVLEAFVFSSDVKRNRASSWFTLASLANFCPHYTAVGNLFGKPNTLLFITCIWWA